MLHRSALCWPILAVPLTMTHHNSAFFIFLPATGCCLSILFKRSSAN